jgi:hypothetical protein
MTTRTCPDWPALMEIAPELQFKHYSVAEAKLPSEVLRATDVPLGDIEICCDLDHHVFYAAHTDPTVGEALRESHWFELDEWASRGPGSTRIA